MRLIGLLLIAAAMTGCTTVGSLGVVAKSSGDVGAMLRSGRSYKELGMTEGKACKQFILGAIPAGDGDLQVAVDRALEHVGGGDALINVTTINCMYGFIPIYNVYTVSCNTVKGMAIRFLDAAPAPQAAAPAATPEEPASKK